MDQLIIGGIYATPSKGGYVLYRVLYADETSVHLSRFSNFYESLPTALDIGQLSFFTPSSSVGKEEGSSLGNALQQLANAEHIGIMHIPLALEGFLKDAPQLVDVQKIEFEDMEGFATYLEAMGMEEEALLNALGYIYHRALANAEEYPR